MEFNEFLNNCQEDDVMSCRSQLHTIDTIKREITNTFDNLVTTSLAKELQNKRIDIAAYSTDDRCRTHANYYAFFKDGIDCQILKAGSNGWQKGKLKLKVTLEFCPNEPEVDEPESPLDDIRQEINKDS